MAFHQSYSAQDELFFQPIIDSYVHNPRFVHRDWFAEEVQQAKDHANGRFVLLAAEPGARKSTFMASDDDTVVKKCKQRQPTIILMDINMPGINCIRATQRILVELPHISIIMLIMLEDDASVFNVIRASAREYLLKGAVPNELSGVIGAIAGEQALIRPAIAARVLGYFKELGSRSGSQRIETPFP